MIGGYRNLYLFPGFSAFWVEISNRWLWESLPFSPVFRLLGRDFRTGELGISTFSAVFRILGRDFRTAAVGISTLFPGFSAFWVEISERRLRDSLPFSEISAFWVEISGWRLQESLPFSPVSRLLGRDFRTAATGISTFFPGFPHYG